jgi:hypothetical protein
MIRVTKANPCPVCERPDWCLIADDGEAAICARVSEGSKKRCGDAGFLHLLTDNQKTHLRKIDRRAFKVVEKPKAEIDFSKLAKEYQDRLSDRQSRWLGESLQITEKSLKRLGTGFDGKAFTFPMRDENLNIIGIRRRFGDGNKKALFGSTNGLFIPTGLGNDKPLVITEGPTDCGAALDLGFEAIGRPNCDSKIDMTVQFARGRKVVIICDNDMPGRDGAKKLAAELIKRCPAVKIICPPLGIKDLREWKQQGFNGGQISYGF